MKYWFDWFQSIYIISNLQGCWCWVAFTLLLCHMLQQQLDWGAHICATGTGVSEQCMHHIQQCFIRGMSGTAWHQCLGPALSSCDGLWYKVLHFGRKNFHGFSCELLADFRQLYVSLWLKRTSLWECSAYMSAMNVAARKWSPVFYVFLCKYMDLLCKKGL